MTTTVRAAGRSAELREIAARRVAASNDASERFFSVYADGIAAACQAMAGRFRRGARLLVWGDAPQRSDVSHAVVEFLHPVIVGKRSLPAIALPNATGRHDGLQTLGRPEDIFLIVVGVECTPSDERMLANAGHLGMLTLLLSGDDARAQRRPADFHFQVPSRDPCIVQETHEMLYHVLWELVHVFLDHQAVRT